MARFAALIFASLVLLVFVTLAFVQQTSEQTLKSNHQQIVANIKRELIGKYEQGGLSGVASHIDQLASTRADPNAIYLLTDRNGKALAGNIAEWPKGLKVPVDWAEVPLFTVWNVTEQPVGISTLQLPGGERLLTGHVLEARTLAQNSMRKGMMLAFPAGLILAVMITAFTITTISRRVDAIVDVTEAVRSGNLAPRVKVNDSGDSFDRLAVHINAMLDQQERLLSQLRVMTDGLAHDLRSPLTRLRATIDRALVEVEDEQSISALENVAHEAEALLTMLSTALQISRAEAGIGRENFTRADLGALLAQMADVYEPMCEDQGMTITVAADRDNRVLIHRQLLSQAIANLIDNALKYARGADAITLRAETKGNEVAVIVADNGVGIPDAQRASALRRFGRLDADRGIAGAGLGLSLAEAVAQLHHGRIELADNAPGLRVSLILSFDSE